MVAEDFAASARREESEWRAPASTTERSEGVVAQRPNNAAIAAKDPRGRAKTVSDCGSLYRHAIGLFAALWLTACAPVSRPDLQRLYRTAGQADVPPLIVIHGVLGARLRNPAGEEVWPGGLSKLAFSSYPDLALPVTGDEPVHPLEAYALFDQAAGRDFYGSIVRTLEQAGGYRRAEAGQPPGAGRHYYLFIYDWRRDNVATVGKLDALIEQIRRDHRRPQLKVDIVAHSNGGLVSRYYARFGTHDWLDGNDFPVSGEGAAKIRRLILLGTPNFGSLQSLRSFIEGAEVGFRRIPPEVLLTMPSAYQLFPHALNDWLLNAKGDPLQRDLFDVELWRRFQWAVFDAAVRARIVKGLDDPARQAARLEQYEAYFARHLERARRFTWSLSVPDRLTRLRPIVFGGDCELTPARLLVEEVNGESVLRLYPKEIRQPRAGIDYGMLMLEPGDGTVTKASLLARESLDPSVPRHPWIRFDYDYAMFLCERHDQLTGNPSFQDNLLQALLSQDR